MVSIVLLYLLLHHSEKTSLPVSTAPLLSTIALLLNHISEDLRREELFTPFLQSIQQPGIHQDNVKNGSSFQVGEPFFISGPSIQTLSPPNHPSLLFQTTTPITTNLVLTKTVDPIAPLMGETITYTLDFRNESAVTATNVLITDIVPSALTNIQYSATLDAGIVITPLAGSTYRWRVSDLPPTVGGQIAITGEVIAGSGTALAAATSTPTATETATSDLTATALAAATSTPTATETATPDLTATTLAPVTATPIPTATATPTATPSLSFYDPTVMELTITLGLVLMIPAVQLVRR